MVCHSIHFAITSIAETAGEVDKAATKVSICGLKVHYHRLPGLEAVSYLLRIVKVRRRDHMRLSR